VIDTTDRPTTESTVAAESAVQTIPPRWDLSDLFASPNDPALEAVLTTLAADSQNFTAQYKGRLAGLSPAEMAQCLKVYEAIQQESMKPEVYAGLCFAADSSPEMGAFYQKIRERSTAASLPLVFFEVEMGDLSAERLTLLANAPELAGFQHFLLKLRDRSQYRLTEPEEKILETQANTGRRAFVRLFEEISANLKIPITLPDGTAKTLTLSEVLDLQSHSDRETRKVAADALTDALESNMRTLAYIYNTLIQDKANEDKLRGLEYPEHARHLMNELSAETVETVIKTSEAGFPLVARYYKAKQRLLGLDALAHYDRYAPLFPDEEPIPYDAARGLILSAFGSFDSVYGETAAQFFTEGWVDAAPAPSKRGGAFCSSVTPDRHPYLFVNYLGRAGDVRTLAHELGHGIHGALARQQSYLNFHGTLPMAEVASTFAETLVFEAQQAECDDRTRLALYAEQIEQSISTIFRQTVLYRFEQAAHRERRENGELSVARFGEIWMEANRAMFGDALILEEGYTYWWAYIRHFISTPFYVYAYTFGEMLAFSLYQKYRTEGQEFVPRYLEMLTAGGSKSPQELVDPLGVNLEDPAFWQGALRVIEAQVAEFEEMAERALK
jgi:oligoendopeptidase F